jgi:hypothetical protein
MRLVYAGQKKPIYSDLFLIIGVSGDHSVHLIKLVKYKAPVIYNLRLMYGGERESAEPPVCGEFVIIIC